MLHDLLVLGYPQSELDPLLATAPLQKRDGVQCYPAATTHIQHFTTPQALVAYLLNYSNHNLTEIPNDSADTDARTRDADRERERDSSVSILINEAIFDSNTGRGHVRKTRSYKASHTDINTLPLDKFVQLIHYRFLSLNPIVFTVGEVPTGRHEKCLQIVEGNISSRLRRIRFWIGLNDEANTAACTRLNLDPSNLRSLDSMMNYLTLAANPPLEEDVRLFFDVLGDNNNFEYASFLRLNYNDEYYIKSLNSWNFNAFQFSLDDLLHIGFLILKRYYATSADFNHLQCFLFFVRDNYRLGNPFHNFRHAIDVLQATNFYLESLKGDPSAAELYQISCLDSFSLLLASLGHDIGHPGITNAFLSSHNTPLALKFNNTSTLENYHRIQFENILIPYLNIARDNKSLNIDINTQSNWGYLLSVVSDAIMATDMAKHDEFVNEIPILANGPTNFKLLACLLIKCADISNVCRPLNISCKWGISLGEEFKQIALLEKYMADPQLHAALLDDDKSICPHFVKAVKEIGADEGVQVVPMLPNNQMFFINRFANDFFGKIVETIPQMQILTETMLKNVQFWKHHQHKSS